MTTLRQTVQHLIGLGLDLIPLRPGSKIPSRAAWNVPIERTLAAVLHEFTRGYPDEQVQAKLPVDDFTRRVANLGVLNEPSKIITLDCDSPLAGRALQAACEALKGDIGSLFPATSWTSVKGSKAFYRRPAGIAAGRVVFKIWNYRNYDVIFELRGTGQDVLPPSWREDAQQRLTWFGGSPPAAVPAMPQWLIALHAELLAGHGPAIDAMHDALDVDSKQLARAQTTTNDMRAYPAGLASFISERAHVNGHYEVAALLASYGYVPEGKRFKPAGTTHAAGIVGPRAGTSENWLCEHEGDVLAGIFDSWRVIVECEFQGDVATAAASVKADQRSRLVHTVEDDPSVVGGAGQEPVQAAASKKPANKDRPERTARHDQVPAKPCTGTEKHKPTQWPQSTTVHADFLTEKIDTIKPIIGGLLQMPPGMHLLSAMPKAGKSTMSTSIVLVATTGRSLSGLTVESPVNALYCAFDESVVQNLQPRIQRLCIHRALPADLFHRHTEIFGYPDQLIDWTDKHQVDIDAPLPGIEWVPDPAMTAAQIKTRAELLRPKFNPYTRALYHYLKDNRIRLCVIDVVSKLREKAGAGKNAYDRDIEEFSAFNAIGISTQCAIIGVHHMNKAAAGNLAAAGVSHMAKVSGTNAIAGAVQSIISMSRYSAPGVDQDALHAIAPVGAKIIIEQTARDSKGLAESAFSLVATPIEGHDGPALEWVHMGPAEILGSSEERNWICEWLYDQHAHDYFSSPAIFTAAVAAGAISSRSKETFRKLLQRMGRSVLESIRGQNGGFRLTAHERTIVKARRDIAGY